VTDGVAVFVVGMHRSGTSAVTGALHALGLAVTTDDDQLTKNQWNEKGFFESKQLLLLNNQLLVTLGGTWSAPPRPASGWEADPGLRRLRRRAGKALHRAFPRRPFVWKDPRNCVTLPFWREVVDEPVAAVFVYRHPLAVGRSLEARGGAGLTYGVALWDRYVRSASEQLAGLPTVAADFDRILEAPAEWAELVAAFLAGLGFETDSEARAAAAASFDSALRHQHVGTTTDLIVGDDQLAVFETLRGREGVHQSWVPPELEPEAPWVEEVLALRRQGDRYRRLEALLRGSRSYRIGRYFWNRHHRRTPGGLLPEL
jgi:hypothetical protein